MKIGCIGQGWIGRNYADHFEERELSLVRYAKEDEYEQNKERIRSCDIVFIAVPTPTTPSGFDASIVEEVLPLVGRGKIAVIKSTIVPGTARRLQKKFKDRIILYSPEFLREAYARYDVDRPERNIIGLPSDTARHRAAAKRVMKILPKAPYERICSSEEAEMTKYAGNTFLYMKVVYMNMLYDLARALGGDWNVIAENLAADSRIGSSHLQPVHASGHADTKGRGAGGHCFIKDFAALRSLYASLLDDPLGRRVFESLEDKNAALLADSGKDADLLEAVYGRRKKRAILGHTR